MRLDQELVRRKLCESRQEARECISSGDVVVNGLVIKKQSKDLGEETALEVLKKRKFVSRGGDKLEGALKYIYHDLQKDFFREKIALDVGSSTGGFTDCLLQYGVKSVAAVDVGTSQLHASLRNKPEVTLFETTDIRNFSSTTKFNIIVVDVSFIALEKIIDTIISFGVDEAEYFLLVKPQFEVGFGNTKKGIVKEATLVDLVLKKYKLLLAEKNYKVITVIPSIIQGKNGNQEYFLYCKK